MSFNSLSHKIISISTLAVLLWNIIGWLGVGLIFNHMHTQGHEGDYCEVSFCSCEVKDGNEYCTCHHADLNDFAETHDEGAHSDKNSTDHESSDYCFYTSPHPVDNGSTTALLTFSKFNALFELTDNLLQPLGIVASTLSQNNLLTEGICSDILRPPRA